MTMPLDIARTLDPPLLMSDAGIVLDPWQATIMRRTAPSSSQPLRRVVMNCSRQVGKSTIAAGIALHRAIAEPGALIVIASPSQAQSDEMVRTIKLLHGKLTGVPELIGDSVRKIEFSNKSRVRALCGDEKTVRGIAGVSLIILDEASRIEDSLIAAVLPFLATRDDGTFLVLSTPCGRSGFFYETWHKAEGWHKVEVKADQCPRISKLHLDEALRELGPLRFSEEYGLQFVDTIESVFSSAMIERAFKADLEPLWT
jgi:phage terminase large subunit-like protein